VYSLAYEAMQVIYDLDCALHPMEESAKHRAWLWSHIRYGAIVPAGKEDTYVIAKNELEYAAGQYIARPWMQNDYIDWCIVDALVRCECAAFYQNLTRCPHYSWATQTSSGPGGCSTSSPMLPRSAFPLWGIWHFYDVDSPWATPAAGLFGVVVA
jgi:hypothetical protein